MPNIKMNSPQVYMCSPFWTLLPPPSPYHPSGSSQCTSPKHPVFSKAFVIVVYSLSCVLLFCEPMDCKPPGSSVCGILQAKNTRVGCHFFLQGMFPVQGLNPQLLCLLHWLADSLPLHDLLSPSWLEVSLAVLNWWK